MFYSLAELKDRQDAALRSRTPLGQVRTNLKAALAGIEVEGQKVRQRRAELALQRAQGLVTTEEEQVWGRRALLNSQAEAARLATEAKAHIVHLLNLEGVNGADEFAAGYWAPESLDRGKVEHYSELVGRALARATTGKAARSVLDEALAGPKEACYAAWKVGPAVLSKSTNVEVKVLTEHADRLLDSRLHSDPQYNAAVAAQNEIALAAADGVAALRKLSIEEVGGRNPYAGGLLGGVSNPNTVAGQADQFRAGNGTVEFFADANDVMREGAAPTAVARYHNLSTTSKTEGVF